MEETLITLFTESIEQLLDTPREALDFAIEAYDWAVSHKYPNVANAMLENATALI